MQTIRLGDRYFDMESEELQRAIEETPDIRATRPVCMCKPAPLEMYVAHIAGRYVIKRMPNTAHLHDPQCASYEAPRAVSGAADVEGRAILHDAESDVTTLRLAFSLSKTNNSHAATQLPSMADTAKSPMSRLTMRAMMDYLWDTAGLNRWHPSMHGKRNYGVVFKYVRRAIEQTLAKRMSLGDALYMPQPFHLPQADGIRDRANAALARCAFQRSGKQALMLLFGEVKSFAEARQGVLAQIKHAPWLSFYLSPALDTTMQRVFEAELALWNARPNLHLMMLASFAQNAGGLYEVVELALMLVDEGWVPVSSLADVQMFGRLAGEGRAFLKGLRFNALVNERFADLLLTDTFAPTAVYYVSGSEPQGLLERLACECEAVGLGVLFLPVAQVATAELPEAKPPKRFQPGRPA